MFGMVQSLDHFYQGWSCIAFIIYACKVVVQLNLALYYEKMKEYVSIASNVKVVMNMDDMLMFITLQSMSDISSITPLNHSTDPGSLVTQ